MVLTGRGHEKGFQRAGHILFLDQDVGDVDLSTL